MVKFPVFWNRGEDKTNEFLKDVLHVEQNADANTPPDPYELARADEREKMMLNDKNVIEFIKAHPQYRAFLLALSPVNRTTKHISKQDAKVMWIDFQILHIMEEMCMNPADYENGGLEDLQGFEIYEGPLISDGFEGFKTQALTVAKKFIAAELSKRK